MWQCPNCGERHEEQFDTCWKCGADQTGGGNPDFHISEPVAEQDQSPEIEKADSQPPVLRLPTITYFSIAAFPWIFFTLFFIDPMLFLNRTSPSLHDINIQPIGIIFTAIVYLLIGLPVAVKMIHACYLDFVRKYTFSGGWFGMTWIFSMFLLPESLRRSHRWFVSVYYVSLVAWFVLPIVIGVWQIMSMYR